MIAATTSLYVCVIVGQAQVLARVAADAIMSPRRLSSQFVDKGNWWANPMDPVASVDSSPKPSTEGGSTKEEFCANNLRALELHMAENEVDLGVITTTTTTNKTDPLIAKLIANKTWTSLASSYDCTCNDGNSEFFVKCSIRHQFTLHNCLKWSNAVGGGDKRRGLGFFDDIGDKISGAGSAVSEAAATTAAATTVAATGVPEATTAAAVTTAAAEAASAAATTVMALPPPASAICLIGGKPFLDCCPSADPNDGICTFLWCVDSDEVTIRDNCECGQVVTSCNQLSGFSAQLEGLGEMCTAVNGCCTVSETTNEDWNTCMETAKGDFTSPDLSPFVQGELPNFDAIMAGPTMTGATAAAGSTAATTAAEAGTDAATVATTGAATAGAMGATTAAADATTMAATEAPGATTAAAVTTAAAGGTSATSAIPLASPASFGCLFGGKDFLDCCPSADPNDGVCTFLWCIDSDEVTVRDNCECGQVVTSCNQLSGFLVQAAGLAEMCIAVNRCCTAGETSNEDWNTCMEAAKGDFTPPDLSIFIKEELPDFDAIFVGGDSNNAETESKVYCIESVDGSVNQIIEEQLDFTLADDDIYHLTQLSWKSSDDNFILSPMEQVIYYKDGNATDCFFNECTCILCDGDPTAYFLDCTPEGGKIIECGSDGSEDIKNNSGPYSRAFDFGQIIKTPEKSDVDDFNATASIQNICGDLTGLEAHMSETIKLQYDEAVAAKAALGIATATDKSPEYPSFDCACSEQGQLNDDTYFAVNCFGQLTRGAQTISFEEQMIFKLDGSLVQMSSGSGSSNETFPHTFVFKFAEDGSGNPDSCSLLGCSSCSVCDDKGSIAWDCGDGQEYTYCFNAEEGVDPLDVASCKSFMTDEGTIDSGIVIVKFHIMQKATCNDGTGLQVLPVAFSYDFEVNAGEEVEEVNSGNTKYPLNVLLALACLTMIACF